MSPLARPEMQPVADISGHLRRWADAMDNHTARAGGEGLGPTWSQADLVELYDTWVATGYALRDLVRTMPDPAATAPRQQLIAVRDGLGRIADIVARQA